MSAHLNFLRGTLRGHLHTPPFRNTARARASAFGPPPQAQFQTSRAGETANAPIRTAKHWAKNFLDVIKDDSSARFSGDSENSEGSPVLGCLLSLHLMPTSSRLVGTSTAAAT